MTAWLNGRFVDGTVPLHLAGPAFRFGLGIFEEILHLGHSLPRFEGHMERMRASLAALGIPHEQPGDMELRRIVLDVVHASGLAGETARVNVYAYQDEPGQTAALCVTAAPHGIDREAERRLAVFPEVHASHLCAHKTMANLHQHLAFEHARREGLDDAVLVDAEGRVLEAARAALLFSDGHGFYAGATPYKLPSLTLEAARRHLPVEEIDISLAGLPEFKHTYWLNSLNGIQPVIQIETVTFEPDWRTCRPLLRELLGLEE